LMPVAAQDLGLALHELATNVSKYGALSAPTGTVDIGWTVDGPPTPGIFI
jgi:two-component sensor histidine kinase